MAVCTRCGTSNGETAKFCSECGAPLAPAPAREQRKVVTVLFCDVTGSTALGERLDPEALRGVMSGYFDTARAAIERHGGTVEKFIGDAVMAVFGIPKVHEDDALRAVRAAVELRDAVEIDVRIGVNTGEVVTGGSDTLVTGDAVNVAARLEQAAGAGEVLIGAATYALVRDAVDAELLPPLGAKGKSEPLTAHRLRAVTGELQRRNAAPMVGRGRELELLARAYERAEHEHACHLFTLLGPAGIGKSRLVAEFLADLSRARVVHGRCLSYGEGITYWPVVEAVKQLPSLPDDETIRAPLRTLLGESDAVSTPPEIAWAVRKAFEHAAVDAPLVVVFDDIQWGEQSFLDLIEHVADLSRGVPILLLCMARPELLDVRPGWAGGKLNATSVLLEPLPAEETEALVRTLAGDDELLVGRVAAAADGNPLFVEEMVELARASSHDVVVPPTIQALLSARLDSLPAAERAVLERGAVEGQVFHRGAVVALAPEEQQVDTRLVSLVRKELVRPDSPLLASDDAYRFRHLLIRDAAYEALPKATRIELHRRFATWLSDNGAGIVELDEIVGYHLEQAALFAVELGQPDATLARAAAERLQTAAARADARTDSMAVANLLDRALALLPDDPGAWETLAPRIAQAMYECGRFDESIALADRLVEGGSPAAAYARVLRSTALMQASSEPFASVFDEMTAGLAALETFGVTPELSGAYTCATIALMHLGRTADAVEAGRRAVSIATQCDDTSHRARALEALQVATVWSAIPWPDALRFLETMADPAAGPRTKARRLSFLGRSRWLTGDFAGGRAALDEALRSLRELGLVVVVGGTLMSRAHLEWVAGDLVAAERTMRDAWDGLGSVGEQGLRSTAGAFLAMVLAELDRVDESESLLEQAVGLAAPDDFVTTYSVLAARAQIALRRGDPEAALALARQAVAAADVADSPDHAVSARLFCADVFRTVAPPEETERLVDEMIALATAKGSTALADRARAVLPLTA